MNRLDVRLKESIEIESRSAYVTFPFALVFMNDHVSLENELVFQSVIKQLESTKQELNHHLTVYCISDTEASRLDRLFRVPYNAPSKDHDS